MALEGEKIVPDGTGPIYYMGIRDQIFTHFITIDNLRKNKKSHKFIIISLSSHQDRKQKPFHIRNQLV